MGEMFNVQRSNWYYVVDCPNCKYCAVLGEASPVEEKNNSAETTLFGNAPTVVSGRSFAPYRLNDARAFICSQAMATQLPVIFSLRRPYRETGYTKMTFCAAIFRSILVLERRTLPLIECY
jgi:hypothetical protein